MAGSGRNACHDLCDETSFSGSYIESQDPAVRGSEYNIPIIPDCWPCPQVLPVCERLRYIDYDYCLASLPIDGLDFIDFPWPVSSIFLSSVIYPFNQHGRQRIIFNEYL